MGRGKDWAPSEELALAKAWKSTSKDPITGTDQQASSFWEAVAKSIAGRDASACSTKWCRMSKIVQKYVGHYNTVSSLVVSGANEDVLQDRANVLFKEKEGSNFTLHLVWAELRSEPKWMSGKELEDAANKKGEGKGEDESGESLGRKAAKRARDNEKLLKEGIQIQKEEVEQQKRVALALENKNELLSKKNSLLEQRNKHQFFTDPRCPVDLSEQYFRAQAMQYLSEGAGAHAEAGEQ
jgi:hypothetical protein